MKKVLSYICICVLLLGSTAYANDSEDIYNEVSEIAAALVTSANIESPLGEAVILMIENDVLNRLTEKGEFTRAESLKASADQALNASANNAEDARKKAISFCNSLKAALSVITALETDSNYITNGDFSETVTLTEDKTFRGLLWSTTTLKAGTVVPAGWEIFDDAPNSGHQLRVARIGTENTHEYLGTKNVLAITGKQIGVQQLVKGLTPGQSYSLSLRTYRDAHLNVVDIVVKFVKYDEDSKTYTSLGSLEDNSGLMKGKLLNQSTSNKNTTTESITKNLFSKTGEVVVDGCLNFVMPPQANAAVVQIKGGAGLASDIVTVVDDVILTEDKELMNGGSFENYDSADLVKYDWYNGDPKAVAEATGNRYLKFSSANTNHRQFIVVKPGKVYKLSFKFAQNGFTGGASPHVVLTDYINQKFSVTPTYRKAESSNLDWKTYETYFTVPTSAEYALDMAVVGLAIGTPNVTWQSGATYSYDDISLQEADETVMGFAVAGANGSFVTDAADAKTASCIYMQGATPAAAKFIVAKYNSTTHVLENATVENAGEGVAAGNAVRYNVELDELSAASYYRIFLLDGTSLTPVLDSQRIG